jgi:hypothetical protein
MSKETKTNPHELDPRIKLRNTWIAGILAYLIPGAGHLYQRRYFKAFVYSFCILGIFIWGSSMGEAKAVHFRFDPPKKKGKSSRTIGFIAQVGVGMPALPAVLQSKRYKRQEQHLTLDAPAGTVLEHFETTFTGLISHRELGRHTVRDAKLVGVLRIGDFGLHEFEATISATGENGEPLDLKLSGTRNREVNGGSMTFLLGPKVCALDDITPINMRIKEDHGDHEARIEREFSASKRRLMATIIGDDLSDDLGRIYGTIPRSFLDHYLVPIEDEALQHLIRKHGKYFELALVYTWIAGLLNVLAIWDAVSGPAYGYGDEPEIDQKKGDKSKSSEQPEESSTSEKSEANPGKNEDENEANSLVDSDAESSNANESEEG